ncbi:MAG: hypothetical protein AAGD01_01220 [Acidobacteriota bacterium]
MLIPRTLIRRSRRRTLPQLSPLLYWLVVAILVSPSFASGQTGVGQGETAERAAAAERAASRDVELPPLPVPKPRLGELPLRPRVAEERLIIPDAGRVAWSVQGDFIAFDRRGEDGYYDIYLSTPEGGQERCLTCPLLETRNAHAMDPRWHPSGRWVVFRVQPRARALKMGAAEITSPAGGLHTELWVISTEGRSFYRLTQTGHGSNSLLHPVFSHEGDRLAFAARVASRRGKWGEWVIRVARFQLGRGVPRLSKVETHQPGQNKLFLSVHGFTPDDRGLILSGNLDAGAPEAGRDLYRYDLVQRNLEPLTRSRGEADAEGLLSPDGRWLAFTSNRNLPPGQRRALGRFIPEARPEPRDLWLLYLGDEDAEGSERATFEPVPLTLFNHPAHVHSKGGVVVDSFAWAPAGAEESELSQGTLLVHAVTDLQTGDEAIWRLEVDLAPPSPALDGPPPAWHSGAPTGAPAPK